MIQCFYTHDSFSPCESFDKISLTSDSSDDSFVLKIKRTINVPIKSKILYFIRLFIDMIFTLLKIYYFFKFTLALLGQNVLNIMYFYIVLLNILDFSPPYDLYGHMYFAHDCSSAC